MTADLPSVERIGEPVPAYAVVAKLPDGTTETMIVGTADGTPARFLEPGEATPIGCVVVKQLDGVSMRDI